MHGTIADVSDCQVEGEFFILPKTLPQVSLTILLEEGHGRKH